MKSNIPTIHPWMFKDKQDELMRIYQQILDIAANSGLFELMDKIASDVKEDMREGFFKDREKKS